MATSAAVTARFNESKQQFTRQVVTDAAIDAIFGTNAGIMLKDLVDFPARQNEIRSFIYDAMQFCLDNRYLERVKAGEFTGNSHILFAVSPVDGTITVVLVSNFDWYGDAPAGEQAILCIPTEGAGWVQDGSTVYLSSIVKRLYEVVREEFYNAPEVEPVGTANPEILRASGDVIVPAVVEFKGIDLYPKGTRVVFTGTTDADSYGFDVILDRDMFPREFAAAFATFAKGWNLSTFDWDDGAEVSDTVYVRGYAAFGGTSITFDSISIDTEYVPAPPPTGNLVNNGTFDTDVSGWLPDEQVAGETLFEFEAGTAKISTSATGGGIFNGGLADLVSVVPVGDKITATFDLNIQNDNDNTEAYARVFDQSGVEVMSTFGPKLVTGDNLGIVVEIPTALVDLHKIAVGLKPINGSGFFSSTHLGNLDNVLIEAETNTDTQALINPNFDSNVDGWSKDPDDTSLTVSWNSSGHLAVQIDESESGYLVYGTFTRTMGAGETLTLDAVCKILGPATTMTGVSASLVNNRGTVVSNTADMNLGAVSSPADYPVNGAMTVNAGEYATGFRIEAKFTTPPAPFAGEAFGWDNFNAVFS